MNAHVAERIVKQDQTVYAREELAFTFNIGEHRQDFFLCACQLFIRETVYRRKIFFGKMNPARIPLQQFFTHPGMSGSLIKKGRG